MKKMFELLLIGMLLGAFTVGCAVQPAPPADPHPITQPVPAIPELNSRGNIETTTATYIDFPLNGLTPAATISLDSYSRPADCQGPDATKPGSRSIRLNITIKTLDDPLDQLSHIGAMAGNWELIDQDGNSIPLDSYVCGGEHGQLSYHLEPHRIYTSHVNLTSPTTKIPRNVKLVWKPMFEWPGVEWNIQ